MTKERVPETVWQRMIGFYDSAALASYRQDSWKYAGGDDYIEGKVCLADEYFTSLDDSARAVEAIGIRFGYRTLATGDLAIAAWMPDVNRCSERHRSIWNAFQLQSPKWLAGYDSRFEMWLRRYIDGEWGIPNGVKFQLEDIVERINALTEETLGLPLFEFTRNPNLRFPMSQNSHRFHDSIRELDGYLVDGLKKDCILKIAERNGTAASINPQEDQTLKALKNALPGLATSALWPTINKTLRPNRAKAAHSVRAPAQYFPAFEKFTEAVESCISAFGEVLANLEEVLQMSGELAKERGKARKWLPTIVSAAIPQSSLYNLNEIVGKTVERVEFGERLDRDSLHRSEAFILHFTDGPSIGVDTGSNIGNLADAHESLRPNDLNIRFYFSSVPPLSSKERP